MLLPLPLSLWVVARCTPLATLQLHRPTLSSSEAKGSPAPIPIPEDQPAAPSSRPMTVVEVTPLTSATRQETTKVGPDLP